MTERLLQFIWQFQYYNKNELVTTGGEQLQVIHPGQHNTNQGPDFLDAKIRMGKTTWAGTVELHHKTTDWVKHQHQRDKNYNNVILHVVWENDKSRNRIPVLELGNRVPKLLLQRYEELMNASSFIPCERSVHQVRDIIWKSWKERLLAERLMRKAGIVETYLRENNYHWEETFWWLLTRNFGIRINADAFEAIARSIPLKILAKHKEQIHQLEALLFGQAGLLKGKFKEDYPRMLQKEYEFLKRKYRFKSSALPVHFLRMRPDNFPTVRLAQLAMLVSGSSHLFSRIREARSLKDVREWFDVTANDYWHYHYRFNAASSFRKKKPGDQMINNIIINTLVPVLFAYGNYNRDQKCKDRALEWLEKTSAENNTITRGFQQIGIENKNAFDSQALIELKNEYCNKKGCIDCAIGNYLLKN